MKFRELQEGNSDFFLSLKLEFYIRKHVASHIFVLFTTSELHGFLLIPEMIAQQWKSMGVSAGKPPGRYTNTGFRNYRLK
jgi:hypothetical protein